MPKKLTLEDLPVKAKDPGEREILQRAMHYETTLCIGCQKEIKPDDSFTWAKTKGSRFIFLCADCAKKEGVAK